MPQTYTEPLYYRPGRLFKKQAMRRVKLSDKPGDWSTEVLDHLYAEYPKLSERDVQLSFRSTDEKTGTAMGKIVIDKKLSIPVFIQKRLMDPLDTCVFKGRPYRITEKRLNEMLFKSALFSGIIRPDEEKALSQDEPIHQQTQANDYREGRRVYAMDNMLEAITAKVMLEKRAATPLYHSIISQILPTISRTDIEKVAQDLNTSPELAANFTANGGLEVLAQVLRLTPSDKNQATKLAMQQLPASVVQVRPISQDSYGVKIASDFGYEPIEMTLAPSQVGGFLENLKLGKEKTAILGKLSTGATFLHTSRTDNVEPVVISDFKKTAEIKTFGTYVVRDPGGTEYAGWIYPQVIDFNKKAVDRMLFISAKGDAALMQEKIAGMPYESDTPRPSDVPKNGDIGCFLFDTETTGLATVPVKIAAITQQEPENEPAYTEIHAVTMRGAPVVLQLSKHAWDIVPMPEKSKEGREYFLLPERAKWAKLHGKATLVSDPGTLTKMALAGEGGNFLKVRGAMKGTYVFQGSPVEKIGAANVEFDTDEAMFKLACLGLSVERSNEVLDLADTGKDVTLSGTFVLGPLQEKVAEMTKRATAAVMQVPFLKRDTLKEASEINDPEIIDRVLSLNFLNPQNIEILVDNIKELEKASSKLSEILIASRYGAKVDIPEEPIVGARKNLDEVIDGLAQLQSRLGAKTDEAD